jgi:hypothetical protein
VSKVVSMEVVSGAVRVLLIDEALAVMLLLDAPVLLPVELVFDPEVEDELDPVVDDDDVVEVVDEEVELVDEVVEVVLVVDDDEVVLLSEVVEVVWLSVGGEGDGESLVKLLDPDDGSTAAIFCSVLKCLYFYNS